MFATSPRLNCGLLWAWLCQCFKRRVSSVAYHNDINFTVKYKGTLIAESYFFSRFLALVTKALKVLSKGSNVFSARYLSSAATTTEAAAQTRAPVGTRCQPGAGPQAVACPRAGAGRLRGAELGGCAQAGALLWGGRGGWGAPGSARGLLESHPTFPEAGSARDAEDARPSPRLAEDRDRRGRGRWRRGPPPRLPHLPGCPGVTGTRLREWNRAAARTVVRLAWRRRWGQVGLRPASELVP